MGQILEDKDPKLEWEATLSQVANGSEPALRRLYAEFSPLVYTIALRVLNDRREAEEITQDVFTKVWRLASRYDKRKASVKSWIVMMARSASIDKLRKRSRRPDTDNRHTYDVFDYPLQDVYDQKSPAFTKAAALVREKLESLRPEYRTCLELAYFKGYSQKEIAAAMNLPEGTAKTYVRRGLQKLRQLFNSA